MWRNSHLIRLLYIFLLDVISVSSYKSCVTWILLWHCLYFVSTGGEASSLHWSPGQTGQKLLLKTKKWMLECQENKSQHTNVPEAAFYVPLVLGWDLVNRFESGINLTLIHLKNVHSEKLTNKEIIKPFINFHIIYWHFQLKTPWTPETLLV